MFKISQKKLMIRRRSIKTNMLGIERLTVAATDVCDVFMLYAFPAFTGIALFLLPSIFKAASCTLEMQMP